MVQAYEESIKIKKSKESAKANLSELSDLMHEVNGAASKGEIDFISPDALDKYWDLKSIFQEIEYRNEPL